MFLNTALAFFCAYLWGWDQALTCPSVEMPWLFLPDAEKNASEGIKHCLVYNRFSCTKLSNCQSILDAIHVNVLQHEHDDLSPITHISEFWWNGSTFGFLFFLFYEYCIFRRASQVTSPLLQRFIQYRLCQSSFTEVNREIKD